MVSHVDVYDEIAEFIANMDPVKVIHFKVSAPVQERFEALLEKEKNEGLTADEKNELDRIMVIDHIISLAKIRARRQLAAA